MQAEAVSLPDLAMRTDAELLGMPPRAFAQALLDKAAAFGTVVMDRRGYALEPLSAAERHERLIEWNRRHAWLEWWNGVVPPSRQIVQLPDSEVALKIRLSQQIIDEVKHQRVFAQRVKSLGGDPHLANYQAPPTLRLMYRYTAQFEDPLDIASSMQCTGEAVLLHHCLPEHSVTFAVLDDETLRAMAEEVAPEETRHVKNGADLIASRCLTAAQRRRVAEVQDLKLRVLAEHYCTDHALLGARRVAPLPTVGGRSLWEP